MQRSTILALTVLAPMGVGLIATQLFWWQTTPAMPASIAVAPAPAAETPQEFGARVQATNTATTQQFAATGGGTVTIPGPGGMQVSAIPGQPAGQPQPAPGEPMLDPKPALDPTPPSAEAPDTAASNSVTATVEATTNASRRSLAGVPLPQ